MGNIKLYKKKLTIELKDGTKLYSDKTLKELNQVLNSGTQFIEIDQVLFNLYEFKKAYIEKINSIQDYILSLPKDQQVIVEEREKYMKETTNKRFKSIKQIENYLKSKNK